MDPILSESGWREYRSRSRALKHRAIAVNRHQDPRIPAPPPGPLPRIHTSSLATSSIPTPPIPAQPIPSSPPPERTAPMAMDSTIVDQGYMYFLMEAPELLQTLEQDLLQLAEDRTTPRVHSLMRTAHTLKGAAASVGLETIKTVAHNLEDVFKALYNPEVVIDSELDMLLLQGFDCLRIPLSAELTGSVVNESEVLQRASTVFAQLQAKLGDFYGQEAEMPTSAELGFDIVQSIFEVGVKEKLEALTVTLAYADPLEIADALGSQAEVFVGLAESLNLPGFGEIAQLVIAALAAHPDQALPIAQVALVDLQQAQAAVLAGDRIRGGDPSPALRQWAGSGSWIDVPSVQVEEVQPSPALIEPALVESIFAALPTQPDPVPAPAHAPLLFDPPPIAAPLPSPVVPAPSLELPSLDSIFGNFKPDPVPPVVAPQPAAAPIPSLDSIFGQIGSVPASAQAKAASPSVQAKPIQPTVAPTPTQPVVPPSDPTPSLDGIFGQFTPPIPAPQVTAQIWGNAEPPLPSARLSTVPASPLAPQEPRTIDARYTTQANPAASGAAQPRPTVRVDVVLLERLNNLVGELLINQNRQVMQNETLQSSVLDLLSRLQRHEQTMSQLQDLSDKSWIVPQFDSPEQRIRPDLSLSQLSSHEGFDLLELDSYSDLQLIVQQALEDMIQMQEAADGIELCARDANQTLEKQQRMLTSVRDDVMQARMLPLGDLFNRFPRMLRELSAKYNKPVELKLRGSEVLVDKAVLEKLFDPLLHLIRNAFDHGIEMPERRLQQGKSDKGQILLQAFSQGGKTVIEVSDDGGGLNIDRIRSRAIELGKFSEAQAPSVPVSQLFDIVFEPGFSTASQVSELSGRGIGLDVVRDQMQSLRGSASVRSQPGQGTTFSLQIPQTLTIARLLVCQTGSQIYAFLTDGIEQILIPKSEQVGLSRGQKVLHLGSGIVPLRQFSALIEYHYPRALPTPAPAPAPLGSAPVLLMRQQQTVVALEVDQLLGEQELVIKPLGSVMTPPGYVYGCSVLGDGRLVLVVDGMALLQPLLAPLSTPVSRPTLPAVPIASAPALPPPAKSASTVLLIVDDSITVRQNLNSTLQRAGYSVIQARDGQEALKLLQQNPAIQLVLSDVEMPHMNGFELLNQTRREPALARIPMVMLTSRSGDKHRQMAMALGASAYLTKPYLENELLSTVKQWALQPSPH